ncbi:MAG TPA: retropepsin-like aspartic protease [Allosphingosinicella sp.]|nr:retropepsin-like aspartic protease [Allosphingosinicella sp.]
MTASVLAAALSAAASLLQAPAPAAVETVPLDLTGPRPIATLTIGTGAPVRVIFDTGASGNVLDAEFARAAGLPDEGPARVGTPAGGPPMIGFRTQIAGGRLGNAALAGVRAVALPMPSMQQLNVRGVFGPGSFSGRLVFLDLGRGEIRVVPKSPATIPALPSHPYSEAGPRSLPGVEVEIGGRRHHAHIDTGQPGMLMAPMAMSGEVPLDGPLADGPPARLADGVPRAVKIGRIRGNVRIGTLVLTNPEIRFMDGLNRVNVGMQAMRGATIVLDSAERRSWVIPPLVVP